MEVFLLEDIPGVGKKDDLLVVGDGYAMNCLLPQRLAMIATPTVRRRYAEQIRRRAEEKQSELTAKESAAGELTGKMLTLNRKATKAGKLYGAITAKHLATELKKQHKLEIPESAFDMTEPIKALGEFTVKINLADLNQDLSVKITEEK